MQENSGESGEMQEIAEIGAIYRGEERGRRQRISGGVAQGF